MFDWIGYSRGEWGMCCLRDLLVFMPRGMEACSKEKAHLLAQGHG